MKLTTRTCSPRTGFTLVELLVVILIIAVLFYKQLYGLRWLATGKTASSTV